MAQRITEIDRLHQALERIIAAPAIPAWLEQPNDAFDGFKPLELIERGQMDRLWRMVWEVEGG